MPRDGGLELTYLTWPTDLGPLMALATDKGLVRLYLRPRDPEEAAEDFAGHRRFRLVSGGALVEAAREQIDEYLGGNRHEFTLPLDLRGTPFQMQVWQTLMKVPFGRVVTYGRLARLAGFPGAARGVGGAMGANPVALVVPCHRVVASQGLGGYGFGGLAVKRLLLGLEGVTEAQLDQARLEV